MAYPTVEEVRESLRYEAGKLYWLDRPRSHFRTDQAWKSFNTKYSGWEAGYDHQDLRQGEIRWFVTIFSQPILRSMIVWVLHHGVWPTSKIDHEDHDTTNDDLSNLRLADSSQNGANRVIGSNNTSGRKGVSYHLASGKFQANIMVRRKLIYLGLYRNVDEAHEKYCEAAKRFFGPFYHPG